MCVCMQVFYGFGLAGIAWSVWWEAVVKGIQRSEPEEYELLTRTAADRCSSP